MVAARILFVFSLLGLVGAVNALAKPNYDLGWALRPWWLFAVLTGELVPLRLAVRGILVGVLWRFGALEHRAGQMGLFLTAVTWVGFQPASPESRTSSIDPVSTWTCTATATIRVPSYCRSMAEAGGRATGGNKPDLFCTGLPSAGGSRPRPPIRLCPTPRRSTS